MHNTLDLDKESSVIGEVVKGGEKYLLSPPLAKDAFILQRIETEADPEKAFELIMAVLDRCGLPISVTAKMTMKEIRLLIEFLTNESKKNLAQ